MKITDIRVRKEHLALTRPYTIAYKTVSDVSVCFVELEVENGMVGWGAANPSQQVVGETVDETFALLSTDQVREAYVGKDIRTLRRLCEDLHQRFPDKPGAKAALDIAFHDLFGQCLGLPLVDYLGRCHEQLATSITIGIKDVAETLEEAQEYYERKFRILKVKLGQSVAEDVERLVKLRERFGNKLGIRVDANQGYSVDDLYYYNQHTRGLDIELVEQPMPADAIETMRALPMEIRQQIAADESLITAKDAYRLVGDPPVCGIFNIKLMKCGGIYQGQRIADIARQAGCKLMWGCNDESIVSISAALHAAFANPHTRFIDLDGSLDLARDLVSGGFMLEEGMMRTVDKPGLGLTVI
jgi:L-alanine-DL-glutamate epimerase-like enolase superfamily enzyme